MAEIKPCPPSGNVAFYIANPRAIMSREARRVSASNTPLRRPESREVDTLFRRTSARTTSHRVRLRTCRKRFVVVDIVESDLARESVSRRASGIGSIPARPIEGEAGITLRRPSFSGERQESSVRFRSLRVDTIPAAKDNTRLIPRRGTQAANGGRL